MMERKRERYCYRVRPSVAALCLSVLLFASGAPAQTVAFINPGKSDEIYWITATQSMQAAAKSLGVSRAGKSASRVALPALSGCQARLGGQRSDGVRCDDGLGSAQGQARR